MQRKVQALPVLILAFSSYFQAQAQVPVSDPEALSIAARSISALTGGAIITDASLAAHVVSAAGSDVEDGTASLFAKGGDQSRVDLSFTADKRSEVRNASQGFPQGTRSSGTQTIPLALHNCWTDAAWFYPALSSLNTTLHPNIVLSYVGAENRNGVPVQHIQAFFQLKNATARTVPLARNASATDIYLDSSTLYPIAVTFNAHPDDDALTNIPVEIDFSNYQLASGVPVPFRIQRYLQGSLSLDLVVTKADFNTGIPDSTFALQ